MVAVLEGNRSEAFSKFSELLNQLKSIKDFFNVEVLNPTVATVELASIAEQEATVLKEMDALWWRLDEDERKSFDPSNEKKYEVIAVNQDEVREFGCPYCGYRSGSAHISGGGGAVWDCGECGRTSIILGEGVTRSPFGLGRGISFNLDGSKKEDGDSFYPELQEHPRKGIPSHGKPDKRPEGGGEFFRSRGVGMDYTPGCFVCGGGDGMRNNIAAYVKCKASGERVVAMFDQGARLDYRKYEPDYVQVKIGACDKHVANLEKLHTLTRDADGVITEAHIKEAKKLVPSEN